MFRIIFLLNLFFLQTAYALEVGMCIPDVKSKKYIKNDTNIDYPKHFIFECDYHCRTDVGLEIIRGTTDITVGRRGAYLQDNRNAEAKQVVCQGVQVKKVSWGHNFNGVKSFYAFDTKILELKEWANNNLTHDNSIEMEKLKQLKIILNQVATSYLTAGNSGAAFKHFEEAGLELLNIASELPYKTDRLDIHLNRLKASQGDVGDINTAEGLILSQLKVQASWRLPIMK